MNFEKYKKLFDESFNKVTPEEFVQEMEALGYEFNKISSNKEPNTETSVAKLRNALSPHYGLPDMVLIMDKRPEIRPLLFKQAEQAKKNSERIRELLTLIENGK